MDDRSLADGCRRGDRAAWDEFVTKYTRFITFAARRQLREANAHLLDDVVQNVFTELLKDNRKAWNRYDPKYRLTTWLGLVVLTQVDHATRGRKLQPVDDRIAELEAAVAPDSDAKELVQKAMPVLSERERMMIALYYTDGLGLKEIEAITGVPANTIGSHLLRAREKLKAEILRIGKAAQ
jgi:RNA polymerase sigma-70 factor (ECF subfamily)